MLGLLRWFAVLLGGLLIGIGVTLHGQVALARHMREEVDNTFVLWRAIGNATFYFQGAENRMALAMSEVPDEALHESDRAAWVLVIIGALIAFCAPLIRSAKPPAKGKPKPKPATASLPRP